MCGRDGTWGTMGLGGDSQIYDTPQYFGNDNIKYISDMMGGGTTNFFIKNDNTVWATGYNGNGNLGLGYKISPKIFTEVTYFRENNITINKIKDTGMQTFYFADDRKVYFTGDDRHEVIGQTKNTDFPEIINKITDNNWNVIDIMCDNDTDIQAYYLIERPEGSTPP